MAISTDSTVAKHYMIASFYKPSTWTEEVGGRVDLVSLEYLCAAVHVFGP